MFLVLEYKEEPRENKLK